MSTLSAVEAVFFAALERENPEAATLLGIAAPDPKGKKQAPPKG